MADAATFFRLAAEANLAVFRRLVVAPFAKAHHVSDAIAAATFAASNSLYALAGNGDRVLRSLPSYFGTGTHAAYAELGGALDALRAHRRAHRRVLVARYVRSVDSRAVRDRERTAFSSMMRLAQAQLGSSIGWLRTKGVNPVVAAADNEVGSVAAVRFGERPFRRARRLLGWLSREPAARVSRWLRGDRRPARHGPGPGVVANQRSRSFFGCRPST